MQVPEGEGMSRITEDCINHNINRLIGEVMGNYIDAISDSDSDDHYRLVLLGTIDGIRLMGEAMKEVLKA